MKENVLIDILFNFFYINLEPKLSYDFKLLLKSLIFPITNDTFF